MKWVAKPEASTRDFFRFAHKSDKVCVDRLRPGATNGRRDLAAMIRAVQGDMRQQVTDGVTKFDPRTVSVSHRRGEIFISERIEEIMIGGPVVDNEPRALVERQCGPEILRPGVFSAHPCEVDALGRQQVREETNDLLIGRSGGPQELEKAVVGPHGVTHQTS